MLSLTHQFLAWCRSKPADEEYDCADVRGCPFALFLIGRGFKSVIVGPFEWWARKWLFPMRGEVPDVLVNTLHQFPRTYGALADRVERQLAEQVTS